MLGKRRNFLSLVFKTGILALFTSAYGPILGKKESRKSFTMKPGMAYEVSANEHIYLPLNAKKGSSCYLKVTAETLRNPAQIKFKGEPILGDKENLKLDSIANIKLTYHSESVGWILS